MMKKMQLMMKKKITIIEQAQFDAEEMITEAHNDYHERTEIINQNIAELREQAAKAKKSDKEKSEIIHGLELKVKALEEALILYRQQINDFANERETKHIQRKKPKQK